MLNPATEPPAKQYLTILLVEDEPIPMLIHQLMLADLGYKKVDTAKNGQQALCLSANQYDLILMDIGLPDLNGFEVTSNIRQKEYSNKQAYIVGLTAYSLEEIKNKCLMTGMDEVISKPITAVQLRQLLDKVNLIALTRDNSL